MKYMYNAAGYLIEVYDVTKGKSPSPKILSISYDADYNVTYMTDYDNRIIAYTTTHTAFGKTVEVFDTSHSGYLGGSVYGKCTINYNKEDQVIDRWRTFSSKNHPDTIEYRTTMHEAFSYDAVGNSKSYLFSKDVSFYGPSGYIGKHPTYAREEFYTSHDTRGSEIYEFEHILLKGVINIIGGNALIDPLNNYVGSSATQYFQHHKHVLLQGDFPAVYDPYTNSFQHYTLNNHPVYDSLGRLTGTGILDYQSGQYAHNLFLEYY